MVVATSYYGNFSPQYQQMQTEKQAIADEPIPRRTFTQQQAPRPIVIEPPLPQVVTTQPQPELTFWGDLSLRGDALMSILKAGGAPTTPESTHLREIGGLQLRG